MDDKRIQEEMDVFPFEALERIKQVGGLADFLRQSLKFAVIDNVVALLSDAKSARQMALMQRQDKEGLCAPSSVPDTWKTVGKGVNDVDSLRESVTGCEGFPNLHISPLSFSSTVSGSGLQTPASRPSNSVSAFKSSTVTSPAMGTVSSMWSEKVNSVDVKFGKQQVTSNALDSIDDFPSGKTAQKSSIDDIDDFDEISDSESDYKRSDSSCNGAKLGTLSTFYTDISRSSSKSDMSDRSVRSDLSPAMSTEPKPLKPLNTGIGLLRAKKGSGMWDKGEKDFDSSSSVFSKDENENGDCGSISSLSNEVKKAGEEFVRKSDEKFVAELADSVVEKLYEGKHVSEKERQETLVRVSADISKDFERSAMAQKSDEFYPWSNSNAGTDYSKNMGKFAKDFMKKHYENEKSVTSPTSNLNMLYQQTTDSGGTSFQTNSGFNSVLHLPSSAINADSTIPQDTFLPQTNIQNKSGYNLFSGPSWGFNSFSNPSGNFGPIKRPVVANVSAQSPLPPASSPQASMANSFIRPPLSASAYYHTPPPNFQQRPPICPPQFAAPGMMPPMFRVEKKDQECQMGQIMVSKETMTSAYEPYKKELMNIKDERDKMLQLMTNNKMMYDKLLQEYNSKEQRIKVSC